MFWIYCGCLCTHDSPMIIQDQYIQAQLSWPHPYAYKSVMLFHLYSVSNSPLHKECTFSLSRSSPCITISSNVEIYGCACTWLLYDHTSIIAGCWSMPTSSSTVFFLSGTLSDDKTSLNCISTCGQNKVLATRSPKILLLRLYF
jgi:hypothetical protein